MRIPYKHVILTTTAAAAMVAFAAANLQAAEDAAAQEAKLIAVLTSNAQPGDKAMACKQLALCGTKNAVPALLPLLGDEHMAAWARIPLEVIPDASVDDGLRDAAGRLKGRCLIGVINSIGIRRDAKAVGLLTAKLKDSDAEVASAAAVVLGRIGDDASLEALKGALDVPAVRAAVAEGCILCAEKRLAADKAAEAVAIYDLIAGKNELPAQRIREATRGAIVARKAAGVPMLVGLLRSADKQLFNLGLTVARELPGKEATAALTAELAKAPADRQSLLALAIADRGDAEALPAILQAAKSGSDSVKLTAAKVVKQMGNASCVPMLLDLAVDKTPAVAAAAIESLGQLKGKEVDAEIAARLSDAKGDVRQVLLQLVGDRVLTAAVPEVIKAASDPDLKVRMQALATLGYAVEFKDLSVLIDRVATPSENAEEAKAALAAFKTACVRMPDTEACAAKIVAAMQIARTPAKVRLLEVLTALNGKTALKAVTAAASDPDTTLQDAGFRLLGKWMTLDAAPALADLAKSSTDAKYQVRAARAYIRLLRQFPMPIAERAAMCRTAMSLAKRDAEKKLVLAALERYPNIDGLKLAADTAEIASLKNDATKAVVVIVQKLGGDSPEMQQALARVGQKRVKIEIVKAEYGVDGKLKDVTDVVRQSVQGFPMLLLKTPVYGAAFGGDPAPGMVKQLRIEYRFDGKPGKATFSENAPIVLPTP